MRAKCPRSALLRAGAKCGPNIRREVKAVLTSLGAGAALLLSLGLSAAPASALTIVLNNKGGVTAGSQAEAGFKAAAAFWESALANSVTVSIDVAFNPLGAGVVGSTGSTQYSTSATSILASLNASKTTAFDQSLVLPSLTSGALKMITSGYKNSVTKAGVNTAAKVYDTDTSNNNRSIVATSANLKALGFTGFTGADASITFSSNFGFDFNPNDGITAGKMDFVGVAIHEIGHALGFVSGVDTYDYYGGPRGPGRNSMINLNNYAVGSVLDLFRYSGDPSNLVAGTAPVLDWSVGTASYFSIDGGASAYMGAKFSTGAYNGDSRQASHWKDNLGLGLLDPTITYGERGTITALDLAAFDAIGWNPVVNVVANSGYRYQSSLTAPYSIEAVPEPASWALLIGGFGLTGAALRRRRATIA